MSTSCHRQPADSPSGQPGAFPGHSRQAVLPLEPPAVLIGRLGHTPEQIRKAHQPQTVRALGMLVAHGPQGVTTADFLAARIARFSARIGELRAVGHSIRMTKLTEHSALYTLEIP